MESLLFIFCFITTNEKLFGENWVIAPKLSKTAFGAAKQQKEGLMWKILYSLFNT
jgi:hypothetical protein